MLIIFFCFSHNQTKAEAIKLEELRIKEEKIELLEAEKEKQMLEAKKREKEVLKDKAPIIDLESEPIMVDPAPVIAVDPVKKSEEGLSGKDIEVIEDALEKLGELATIHSFSFNNKTQGSSSSKHLLSK